MPTSDRQKNDPLAMAVLSLVDAMRADFGSRFTRDFADNDQLTQLKRRLYGKLRGYSPGAILDGYETLVGLRPQFVPSVPEIAEAAKEAQSRINRKLEHQENIQAIEHKPKIDKPAIDVMQLLEKAKNEARRDLSAEKRKEAIVMHEQLIAACRASGEVKSVVFEHRHECAVPHCKKVGGISHGTKGDGEYFCAEHFRA